MKVEFIGMDEGSRRQNYRDFAIEIITETDFEQTFFATIFNSRGGKSMYPKGALLCSSARGISVMIESEDFNESQLAKEREERENKE